MSVHPELVDKFDEINSEFDQENKSEFFMKSTESLKSVESVTDMETNRHYLIDHDYYKTIKADKLNQTEEMVSSFDPTGKDFSQNDDNLIDFDTAEDENLETRNKTESLESVNVIEKSEKPERIKKIVEVAMETNRHFLLDHDYCQIMKAENLNQNEEIFPNSDPAESQDEENYIDFDNGNMGCQVFSRGIQN